MNFEFLKRTLSALLLFPLLILVLLKGPSFLIYLLILLCASISWFEWSGLFQFSRKLFILGLLFLSLTLFLLQKFSPFYLVAFLLIFSFFSFLFSFDPVKFYQTFFPFCLGLIYLFIGFYPFTIISFEYPREFLVFFFAVVFANDTGAYLIGKLVGRKAFTPKLSPKKTWEGFLGGVIFSLIVGFLLNRYFGFWSYTLALFISLSLSLFGVLGDLFESAVKRAVGKKDAGALIPGHGGLLDRIDGVLFASPVFLFLIEVFSHGTHP